MRRCLLTMLFVGAVLPALCRADDAKDAKPDKAKSPFEQYEAAVKDYQTAMNEFFKVYQTAKTDEERGKIYNEKYPKAENYAAIMMKIADENPKDPAAVDALVWVATNNGGGAMVEMKNRALAILSERHVESDKMGRVCQSLIYQQSPAAEKLLRTVADKNPHHDVKGQAYMSLGQYLKRQPGHADEAEKLFERVAAEFGDVKSYRGALADAAKAELFEIRNLAIGKTAPDIEGEDIDGKKFKLSDYRGKVVVIDFWGNW